MTFPDLDQFDTLPKLLLHNADRWPDEVAMREKEFGIWNEYSWRDYRDQVKAIALGLAALGVARGKRVAILGRNRPNWVWSELAAQALGAIPVGIYEDVLPPEAGYLINAAEACVVVCEDEEQVDKILELGGTVPSVRHIVFHDPRGMRKYDDPRLVSWERLYALGRELEAQDPERFAREVAAGHGDEVAVLCTTSGTTANPKLAMLGHRRTLEHARRWLEAELRGPGDEYVSVLALPWIVEQIYVVVMPLLSRMRVNFPESVDTAMQDLREIGPTHLLYAPRVWEQIAADVRARILDANPLNRWLFDLALRRGLEALARGRRSHLADALMFGALRDRLGFRRLKSASTGGAALGPDTFRFFLAMGVPLRQLYGQTELGGAYTIQRLGEIDFESSGYPFAGCEVRIADPDEQGLGEIQAKTPGMFLGYWRNEEATRESLTEDGFMRTGDAGYFDEKGRLVVVDRLKDLALTSTGIKFSPQYIENKLKFSPYIGEAVVLGRERPWLAAIICIRWSMVSKWAESRGIAFTNYQNLAANPAVAELIAGEVERVNDGLPDAQRIRRFVLLHKELDPDDGEVTRTRKVRRGVIDERYRLIIDAIYAGLPRVHYVGEVTFEDGRRGTVEADLVIHDTRAHREAERRAA